MLEQRARLGATIDAFAQCACVRCQPPIHLAWTDLQQLLFQFGTQREVLLDPRQPQRQECFQAH